MRTFVRGNQQECLVGEFLSQLFPSHVGERFGFVLVSGEREVLKNMRNVAQGLGRLFGGRGADR